MSDDWGLKDLITIGTPIFFFGGLAYMVRQTQRDTIDIKQDLKALNTVITNVAVQDTRLTNLERRLDEQFKSLTDDVKDLKHGKGFIQA